MNQQQNLDALVQSLRASADSFDPEHPPLGPPIGEWQHRLGKLRDYRQRAFISDSQRPLLAELLALEHDDAEFLHSAYQCLLGRAPDADGLQHYRPRIVRQGRLYVLVELAYASEGHSHRQSHAIDLPAELARLLTWRARLARLGPLQGAALRLWSRLLTRFTYRYGPRWIRNARLQQLTVEMPFMADSLLELSERQNHLVTQQQHAYIRQRAVAQQADVTHPPEGYQAFVAACKAERAEVALDTSPLGDDCIKARQAGAQACDLGSVPPQWHVWLKEWGFNLSNSDDDLQLASAQGLSLVSGFGLTGRMSLPQLYRLVASARHVLAPGGMLLLDMPSPTVSVPGEHRPAPEIIERLLAYHGFTERAWYDLHTAGSATPHYALVGFTPREHT